MDDPLPARELDEHLLTVVRPATRELVAPASAGERFPAVLGDGEIVVASAALTRFRLASPACSKASRWSESTSAKPCCECGTA
jgi:hypothetical protein